MLEGQNMAAGHMRHTNLTKKTVAVHAQLRAATANWRSPHLKTPTRYCHRSGTSFHENCGRRRPPRHDAAVTLENHLAVRRCLGTAAVNGHRTRATRECPLTPGGQRVRAASHCTPQGSVHCTGRTAAAVLWAAAAAETMASDRAPKTWLQYGTDCRGPHSGDPTSRSKISAQEMAPKACPP